MQGDRLNHIKLFAFDLDGTALVRHKTLSPKNREALLKARERSILTVPATGRIRSFLPPDIATLPGLRYAITSNGGAVVDLVSGETLYSAVIPNASAAQVQEILKDYDIYIEYYVNGRAVTLRGNPERALRDRLFPASKHHFLTKDYFYVDDLSSIFSKSVICPEKINLPYLPAAVRRELFLRLSELPGLKLTSSIPDNLEINAATATKGRALKALCSFLNIGREECMAIGDNGNDVDMLAFAGVSVAMGNASEEALRAARHVTGRCEEDGLAQAIEKFLL